MKFVGSKYPMGKNSHTQRMTTLGVRKRKLTNEFSNLPTSSFNTHFVSPCETESSTPVVSPVEIPLACKDCVKRQKELVYLREVVNKTTEKFVEKMYDLHQQQAEKSIQASARDWISTIHRAFLVNGLDCETTELLKKIHSDIEQSLKKKKM